MGFQVSMHPGHRRDLPHTSQGRLNDLVETAKAHSCAKAEFLFPIIKQQFGFQKTRLLGMVKNC